MIIFKNSSSIKIKVYENQKEFLSNEEKIKKVIKQDDVIGFDIYSDDRLIGFVMLQEFDKNCFFLWDYAIDYKYQNNNYGVLALEKLIGMMKNKYNLKIMTTTYKIGNEHAKHIYEKIGFVQTDIVKEQNEVNMIYVV